MHNYAETLDSSYLQRMGSSHSGGILVAFFNVNVLNQSISREKSTPYWEEHSSQYIPYELWTQPVVTNQTGPTVMG